MMKLGSSDGCYRVKLIDIPLSSQGDKSGLLTALSTLRGICDGRAQCTLESLLLLCPDTIRSRLEVALRANHLPFQSATLRRLSHH